MASLPSSSGLWRRERRVVAHALLVGLFCSVSALTSSGCEPDGDSGGDEPAAARFGVGTAAYEWVDQSRPELYTEAEDDFRTVPVRVWYPARASDADRAPYFLDPAQAALTAQSMGVSPDTFDGVRLPARVGAPLPRGNQRFPVLIFSPGMSTPPEFYGYQLADLASRGYVVFALAHIYATGSRVLSDGSIAPELEEPGPEVREASVTTWSADQSFVLSRVAELARSASSDRMARRLDLSHVGVFGHSRGGGAAAQSCLDDPRFTACANLDGSVSPRVMADHVSKPFLLMRSDIQEGTLSTFFEHLSGPAHRIDVEGAGHNSYSDLPRVVRDLQLPFDAEGLLLGSLEPERAFEINAAYLAAFFDAELRGVGDQWFFEPPPFVEVEVTHGGSSVTER